MLSKFEPDKLAPIQLARVIQAPVKLTAVAWVPLSALLSARSAPSKLALCNFAQEKKAPMQLA